MFRVLESRAERDRPAERFTHHDRALFHRSGLLDHAAEIICKDFHARGIIAQSVGSYRIRLFEEGDLPVEQVPGAIHARHQNHGWAGSAHGNARIVILQESLHGGTNPKHHKAAHGPLLANRLDGEHACARRNHHLRTLGTSGCTAMVAARKTSWFESAPPDRPVEQRAYSFLYHLCPGVAVHLPACHTAGRLAYAGPGGNANCRPGLAASRFCALCSFEPFRPYTCRHVLPGIASLDSSFAAGGRAPWPASLYQQPRTQRLQPSRI